MHLGGTAGAVEVIGNAKFPVNNGGLCIKGWAAGATLVHADRLLTPLVRTRGGALEPAPWDDALDLIVRRLRAAREHHGEDAVGVFGGGSLTNEKAYWLGKLARVARSSTRRASTTHWPTSTSRSRSAPWAGPRAASGV